MNAAVREEAREQEKRRTEEEEEERRCECSSSSPSMVSKVNAIHKVHTTINYIQ